MVSWYHNNETSSLKTFNDNGTDVNKQGEIKLKNVCVYE